MANGRDNSSRVDSHLTDPLTPPSSTKQTQSLAGNVGTNDVDDVYQATQAALQLRDPDSNQPVVDPTRVGIVGGSHGGFLGAHVIAAHPELYRVAALRNPVTNIPSMVRDPLVVWVGWVV